MNDKIIISRIRFNERIAVITVTESSSEKKRVATKVMRRIAAQERKHNKPVMLVEMNKNEAQTLFASKALETVSV